MQTRRFADRTDAGRRLAAELLSYAGRSDVIVLGLPRGGVPVAAEVAARLPAPLDVLLVRKLGVPGHEELAMGAIAEGGIEVLDRTLIRALGIPTAAIERVSVRERLEMERRDRLYRGGRRPPNLRDRVVILVDDGLATGSTMQAAILAVRQQGARTIVATAPVGAEATCARLRHVADEVVCAETPADLVAVGRWYEDFTQTGDDDVRRLIGARTPGGPVTRTTGDAEMAAFVADRARVLTDDPADLDMLIDALGDARVVMLGEATHGTHEFYRMRALITRRLIVEKGFAGVAVEADWPDATRVNRYVRGAGPDEDAADALGDFERFPSWMWRNADVLDFIGWLRAHNDGQPEVQRAGFYGLDLYSLHHSMRAVIAFLQKVDPAAVARARERYACFDRFGADERVYAQAAAYGIESSCEHEVVAQLVELRRRAAEYAQRDGRLAYDDLFVAEQNARVVRDAEAYYRTMFGGHVESWNLRDRHMAQTLSDLIAFLGRRFATPRVVVWAHNSHLGDARATEMGERGELNVGQLVRETFASAAVNVGFTTFTGTVTAAVDWDGPAHRRHVRPALPTSYERLFHDAGVPRFLLSLRTDLDLASALAPRRLERAIGVLYRPETERHSHYFRAVLPHQFDYVLHVDETRAVEPLDRTSHWETGELAETYPSGL